MPNSMVERERQYLMFKGRSLCCILMIIWCKPQNWWRVYLLTYSNAGVYLETAWESYLVAWECDQIESLTVVLLVQRPARPALLNGNMYVCNNKLWIQVDAIHALSWEGRRCPNQALISVLLVSWALWTMIKFYTNCGCYTANYSKCHSSYLSPG